MPRPGKGKFPRVEEITELSVHKSSLLLSGTLPLSVVKSVAKIYQVLLPQYRVLLDHRNWTRAAPEKCKELFSMRLQLCKNH